MDGGSSYISIGDMYKGNKVVLPDRWKGKGFSVSVPQRVYVGGTCHETLMLQVAR